MVEKSILVEHKAKWDALATEDDRNAVRSLGQTQTDEEYEESGRTNITDFILSDQILRARLPDLSKLSLLEIGCGSGRLTKTLVRLFRHVTAVDISPVMLDKARKFVAADNVAFVESDGANVPAAPEAFDLAFSYIVYQHFPSKEAIYTSFRGVCTALKPRGLFKVQVRGVEHPDPEHWSWGPHFSEPEAMILATQTGFDVISKSGSAKRSFWLLLEKK